MPDSGANAEILGGLMLPLGLDYSSLVDAFAAAQGLAEAAGGDIADALSAGGAAGADLGTEISSGLEEVPPAANQATASVTGLTESLTEATPPAEDATHALEQMAEQMVAVGEALVITEGLQELGSEALAASDSISTAKTALTAITGSAETAEAQIEGLESLGMADGLAMPSLLTAAQRMTQLLPPGTDIVTLLGHIADGAAVMSTDIEQASQRFAMIADQGTLSARSLGTLGLSLETVATAMNAVDPSADATAATVSSMFKAMDPGDRITVLEQALTKLAGTAQVVAGETFGGEWQQLADAWEAIMAQVGQAILPVITDLLEFTKTEIIPFVQGAVSAFTALPGPVKDAAVAVALLAAAAIPLAGAISAGSLALSGLGNVIPAITGAMGALGLVTTATAAAETAEAVSVAAVGTAAAAATPEIAAEAVATEAAGVAASTSAVQFDLFAHEALAADWSAGASQLGLFAEAEAGAGTAATAANTGFLAANVGVGALMIGVVAITAELGYLLGAYNEMTAAQSRAKASADEAGNSAVALSVKLHGLGVDTAALDFQYASGKSTLAEYNNALLVLVNQYSALHDKETGAADLDASVVSGMKNVLTSVHDASDAYRVAQQVYDQMVQSQRTGNPILGITAATAADVAKALKDMQGAAAAAGVTLAPLPGSLDAINQQTNALVNGMGNLASSEQIASAQADAHRDKLTTLSAALITAQEKLVLTDDAQKQIAQSAETGAASQADLITAMGNTEKAADDVAKAQKAYDDAMVKAGEDAVTTGGQMQSSMLAALQSLAAAVDPAIAKMLGLDAQITALQSAMPNFGISMSNLSSGPLVGLQSALAEASAKVADLSAKMQDGQNVGQQYEKALTAQLNAQIALDQESAVFSAGLQGVTGSTALLYAAVLEAKAKYDDLVSAWQQGLPVLSQLTAAQNALTAAQKNLSAAQQQGTTATNALTTANQALAASAPATAAGLSQIGSAASTTASDLTQTADAMDNLIAALQKGIEVSANNSGIMYTMFGNVTTAQGLAAMLDAENYLYNAMSAPALTSEQQSANDASRTSTEQQLYNEGYTPVAIAKKMGVPVATVISDLGISADDESITKAQAGGSSGTLLLDTNQPIGPILGVPTGTTGGSTTTPGGSPAVPVTTSSGGGTGAIDGGSYPAVTAHQAAGETWSVSANGAATGATISTGSTAAQTITNIVGATSGASTAAISTAAGAMSASAEQMGALSNGLLPISSSLAATASATQQVVTAIGGILQRLEVGTGGLNPSGYSPSQVAPGTISTAAPGGVQTYYPGANPQAGGGPSVGTPGSTTAPPVSGPASAGPQITVNVDARGALGLSGPQISQLVPPSWSISYLPPARG